MHMKPQTKQQKLQKGIHFFIQQLCKIVYDKTNKDVIELSDVENCIDEFLSSLDERFFKSRYERCAESDKKFIFAMVECGELPCTISNVAHNLNKTVGSISTTRAQLISKGIIYPVRYKELDFTVPEFSGYIQRLEEYKQWCISKQNQTVTLCELSENIPIKLLSTKSFHDIIIGRKQ